MGRGKVMGLTVSGIVILMCKEWGELEQKCGPV